ncbi:hypothetical protein K0M31_013086, partial [Melipona bicolor]
PSVDDDCNSIEVLSMQDDGKISILLFVRNTGSRVEQCGPKADSMQIQTNCIRPSRRPPSPSPVAPDPKALLDAFHRPRRREIEEYFLRQLYWRPDESFVEIPTYSAAPVANFQEQIHPLSFPPEPRNEDRSRRTNRLVVCLATRRTIKNHGTAASSVFVLLELSEERFDVLERFELPAGRSVGNIRGGIDTANKTR